MILDIKFKDHTLDNIYYPDNDFIITQSDIIFTMGNKEVWISLSIVNHINVYKVIE
jgi:hypothetical protein